MVKIITLVIAYWLLFVHDWRTEEMSKSYKKPQLPRLILKKDYEKKEIIQTIYGC